jgi:hypothetical protein
MLLKYVVLFAGSALASAVLLASPLVEAQYRVIPPQFCTGTDSTAGYCGVPTGTEFQSTNINTIEIDFYSSGTTTTEAVGCRHAWNGNTGSCSAAVGGSFSGAFSLYPAASIFTGGTVYDYRYVWWSTSYNGNAELLGVYVTNTDP